MNIPDPRKLMMTRGVLSMKKESEPEGDYLFQIALSRTILSQFEKEPAECTDGGNDKFFFTVIFRGEKLFIAANEVGGLTVMKPEEY